MKRVWHMVRKDLIRLRLPLGLWVGLVVTSTALFGAATMPAFAASSDVIINWIQGLHGMSVAAVLLQSLVAVLLMAAVVFEDPPGSTTAFWRTRPISGSRLLIAKLVGAVLLFAVIPSGALLLLQLGWGFSVGEALGAALENGGWQAVLMVPALGLAVLSRGFGRFVVSAFLVVTVVGSMLLTRDPEAAVTGLATRWAESTGLAIIGILWVGMLAVLAGGYLGRTRFAWATLALTIGLMIVVRWRWTDDQAGRAVTTETIPAATWRVVTAPGKEPELLLALRREGEGTVFLAPTAGLIRGKDGAVEMRLERGRCWGEEAARQAAGLARGSSEVSWDLSLRRARGLADQLRERADVPALEVRLAMMRAQVLWEMPLREQEERQAGSAVTRVVSIGWSADRKLRRAVIEERDARLAWDYGIERSASDAHLRRRDEVKADCFLLVNRKRGYARALAIEEQGVARHHGVMLTARVLEFAPAVPVGRDFAQWDDEATIVKVRFTSEGTRIGGMPAAKATVRQEN